MASKVRAEAGFTLLEMLVVIVLTAAFMSIVMTLPLKSLHKTERSTDVAARFSVWLDQQQGNSIYASDPQRVCFEAHQFVLQTYRQGLWRESQARFILPKKMEATPTPSDPQQDGSPPCFLLAFNTLLPAGSVTFGPQPRVEVAWGSGSPSGMHP